MAEMTGRYEEDILSVARFELPWEKLNHCRVLVSGATGLIGGCVVDVLMAHEPLNYHVYASGRNRERAAKRFRRYAGSDHFHFLRMDVTEAITSDLHFEYIIDAAGGATPALYQTDPVGVMRANFYGVDHLLNFGKDHGLRKFVYVSSGEIYGEGDGRAFTEDYSGYVDCTQTRSCYPSAKRAAETLCVSYAHQFGLDVSIARPSHVYGPYFTESDNRAYAQFVRNILRGEDIVLKSEGKAFRSWTYVADCANAIVCLLLKGKTGEAYNVANEESNVTIRTLAELMAKAGGRRVVFDIPECDSRGITTPITKAVFSTRKLESLGWKPLFDLETGIGHTINTLSV